MKIIDWIRSKRKIKDVIVKLKFEIPPTVKGNEVNVAMDSADQLAMDSAMDCLNNSGLPFNYANLGGVGFIGFPQMAILSRNGLVKNAINTVADEIVKMGIEIYSDDNSTKELIQKLNDAMEEFALMHTFQKTMRKTFTFGGAFIYPKLAGDEEELELHLPPNSSKLGKGCLQYLKVIEPTFIAPVTFNASDALKENFYRPDKWQVLGKTVDESRLIHFTYNDVDELLLPSYRFQGQSFIELGLTYLMSVVSRRDNIDAIIKRLNQLVLKTKMGSLINYDAQDNQLADLDMFDQRLQLLNEYLGNENLLAIDMAKEDFVNVSMNLTHLDKLFTQSLEMLAGIWKIPITKLLGTAAQGMNATGEGDADNFRDMVGSTQRRFTPQMAYLLDILQLHVTGEVNPAIKFRWQPLEVQNELELSQIKLNTAQSHSVYKNDGVLTAEEIRGALASDENSDFKDIPTENPDLDTGDDMDDYSDRG